MPMMARSVRRFITGRIYDCIRFRSNATIVYFLADIREESIYAVSRLHIVSVLTDTWIQRNGRLLHRRRLIEPGFVKKTCDCVTRLPIVGMVERRVLPLLGSPSSAQLLAAHGVDSRRGVHARRNRLRRRRWRSVAYRLPSNTAQSPSRQP